MHCLVLFADTDAGRLEARVDFFEGHGFRCLSARSGSEALETAANYKPHIVVLCEELPDVQGTDVCLRIKQEFETSHAWVIMVGTDASREERFVSGEVGADAFVTNDVSNDELLFKVHELLRKPLSDA